MKSFVKKCSLKLGKTGFNCNPVSMSVLCKSPTGIVVISENGNIDFID